MLECTYTQVKNTAGQVISVRACCPSCETNEFVTYSALRNRPLDNVNAMSMFIDVKCECRNPKCEGYLKTVKALKLTVSSSIPEAVHFTFSNVDPKLVHELYPAIASTLYPFIVILSASTTTCSTCVTSSDSVRLKSQRRLWCGLFSFVPIQSFKKLQRYALVLTARLKFLTWPS